MINVTTAQILQIIGEAYVQIKMLEVEVERLKQLVNQRTEAKEDKPKK